MQLLRVRGEKKRRIKRKEVTGFLPCINQKREKKFIFIGGSRLVRDYRKYHYIFLCYFILYLRCGDIALCI